MRPAIALALLASCVPESGNPVARQYCQQRIDCDRYSGSYADCYKGVQFRLEQLDLTGQHECQEARRQHYRCEAGIDCGEQREWYWQQDYRCGEEWRRVVDECDVLVVVPNK